MATIGRIIASGALLAGLLGCGPKPFEYTGTWKGSRKVDAAPGTDPTILGSLERVELTVDTNHRFELFEDGLPKEGRLSRTGEGANLEVDTILNTPPPAPLVFGITHRPDGALELSDPERKGEPPVLLRRESKPTG